MALGQRFKAKDHRFYSMGSIRAIDQFVGAPNFDYPKPGRQHENKENVCRKRHQQLDSNGAESQVKAQSILSPNQESPSQNVPCLLSQVDQLPMHENFKGRPS